jgi:alpha-L-arabinofuranosidase
VMQSDKLLDYNSIAEPRKIAPIEKEIKGIGKTIKYDLQPHSFQVIVVDLK